MLIHTFQGVWILPFCCFENDNENNSFVLLDNNFVTSFMPECNELELKVYIFGLYLCAKPLSKDNSIEHIKDALNISEKDLLEIFSSLEQKGLVAIYSYDPLQIQYRRGDNRQASKLYKKEKYADFNAQLEAYFPDKMIVNPNQYVQYYDFIESSNMQPEALLMIIKHCVDTKGSSVSGNYILQVARSWVQDGIRSIAQVEDRILQRELNAGNLKEIAAAIGKTSQITEEDKDFYTKWTENWGYDMPAILAACKKSLKSMSKLDTVLDDCFKNGAISSLEVETYIKNKKKLVENAIQVIKELGTYYEYTAPVVEEYISPWQQKGYSSEGIVMIAKYCFRNSIKRLPEMDHIVNTFFNMGIISDEALAQHFEKLQKDDEKITHLLELLGSSRIVTINDRDMFNIWTNTWGFTYDTICEVAKLCVGKPLGEIAKKLSLLKSSGIFNADAVEGFFNNQKIKKTKFSESDREYDRESVESSLISDDDLGNVEM
jgi:hypothetical protein